METETGSHLSIGEVLSLLKDEFPDITISKIRFLESQGLIDPERTPSGYRKFYEPDIDRLRWVLRQQRDHFLPLKVIKARLDQGGVDFDEEMSAQQPNLFDDALADPPTAEVAPDAAATANGTSDAVDPVDPVPEVSAEAAPAPEATPEGKDPAAWLAALQEAPKTSRRATASRPVEPLLDPEGEPSGRHYGAAELAEFAGVSIETVEQLAEFGLITTSSFGGEVSYDDAALAVVTAASAFVGRGIEPRHLRSYKLAAEREAGLFEQLSLPLLRQRNPQSRLEAAELVSELTGHGEVLRRALLRQAMRSHVGPR